MTRDQSGWQPHPTCPDCGRFLQEDFGDWTCSKCEKHFIVEEAYRVIGPDEERNKFTEEMKALVATRASIDVEGDQT